MNKTTILGILIAIAALGGLIWIARPDPKNSTASVSKISNGLLAAEEENFDFGEISMAAGEVLHSFKVKNSGPESVTVNKIYTSCMCTTALFEKNGKKFGPYGMPGHGFIPKINQEINPNEEVAIKVIFDPAAHGPAGVGPIQRVVTVENNAGQPLEFRFTAMVTP